MSLGGVVLGGLLLGPLPTLGYGAGLEPPPPPPPPPSNTLIGGIIPLGLGRGPLPTLGYGSGLTPPPIPPIPPEPDAVIIVPSGGFPEFPADRGASKEQTRRSRVLHGLPVAEADVVSEVAKRQVEVLSTDEVKKQQELLGELRLKGIEVRSEHFQALADVRERLIDEEIGLRLRRLRDNEDIVLLLLIAAASI